VPEGANDLALSADGKSLYVATDGYPSIVAIPIRGDGSAGAAKVSAVSVTGQGKLVKAWSEGDQSYLDVEFTFTGISAKSAFTLQLHTGADEATAVHLNGARSRLIVDRTHSGRTDFHRAFSSRHEAPLRLIEGRVALRLLLDTSSLEVFAQNGETVLTELIFPAAGPRRLSLTNSGETMRVDGITIHAIR
jgi:sucrose-6-phosphate hydrolase SacC (GH32 family)